MTEQGLSDKLVAALEKRECDYWSIEALAAVLQALALHRLAKLAEDDPIRRQFGDVK